jgi:hypothetical protein
MLAVAIPNLICRRKTQLFAVTYLSGNIPAIFQPQFIDRRIGLPDSQPCPQEEGIT